jgi:hypothetical protein
MAQKSLIVAILLVFWYIGATSGGEVFEIQEKGQRLQLNVIGSQT